MRVLALSAAAFAAVSASNLRKTIPKEPSLTLTHPRTHTDAGVSAGGIDPPTQIHVAYAAPSGVGTGMSIMWVTNSSTATSVVMYGTSATSLPHTSTGSCSTYLQTFDHVVLLSGLTPKTVYFYQVGDATAGYSDVLNFTTAAAPGQEFPLDIAVIGDMGNWNSANTFTDLGRIVNDMDFILHIGDISYADDAFLHDPFHFGYEAVYNKYMNAMQPYTSTKAYMTCPGNHEAECHSPICFLDDKYRTALGNFTAYNHRFRMPSPESNGTMNMWYSFEYGSVHFIMLDAETDYPNAPNDDYASKNGGFGDQLTWVKQDLAQAAYRRSRGEISWIIATGHRPIYSRDNTDASGKPTGGSAAMQAAFENLFKMYGVDLYLAGHVHGTERSFPVYNSTWVTSYSNPPYTTYVVTGAAGCDEGLTDYTNAPVVGWNNFTDGSNFGLSTLTLQDKNTLTWSFRRATDGTVLDSFTLTRNH